jgi:periplasmic divalent cation tolerance protein
VAENNKGPDATVVEGVLPAGCLAALVYTTFATREAAIAAGRALVEERLAGCVNIIPAMTSIFVWNGVSEVADEVVLLAKVPPEAAGACVAALKRLHTYENPALLVLPVAAGGADYLAWLRAGTGPVAGPDGAPTPGPNRNG